MPTTSSFGEGIEFRDAYPGDGALLLFYENAKQREHWEDFLTRDVPMQFPASRYMLFDRPALAAGRSPPAPLDLLHQTTRHRSSRAPVLIGQLVMAAAGQRFLSSTSRCAAGALEQGAHTLDSDALKR